MLVSIEPLRFDIDPMLLVERVARHVGAFLSSFGEAYLLVSAVVEASEGSSPGTFTCVVAVDAWSTRISIGSSISSGPISTVGLNTEGDRSLSLRGLKRHPLRPGTLSSLIGNTVTVSPRMQSRRTWR